MFSFLKKFHSNGLIIVKLSNDFDSLYLRLKKLDQKDVVFNKTELKQELIVLAQLFLILIKGLDENINIGTKMIVPQIALKRITIADAIRAINILIFSIAEKLKATEEVLTFFNDDTWLENIH